MEHPPLPVLHHDDAFVALGKPSGLLVPRESHSWAELLRRVSLVYVLVRPHA